MTVLAFLQAYSPCEAQDIAEALCLPIESVYRALVAAEAKGLARVLVHSPDSGTPWCEWVAHG